MKYRYREVRKIREDDLRNLCIAKRWYTRGDNAAYNHLIALDIMEHSNTEQELTSICFDVARIAVTFFEEV